MSQLDWLIVGGYLFFSVSLGLFFSRRALQSVDDYFVSGRSFPWWLAGVSMVASAFAIDTPLGITGLVADNGIPGVWFAWSFVLGGAGTLGAFIFSAMLRRSRIITTAELIELRYSGPQAAALRGFKGIYFGVFANAITLGWILKAVWTLSEVVVPGIDRDLLLFVLLLFTLIYTAMSGLWGIAATDFIQFIIGSIGSFLLAFYSWRYIGGIDQVVAGFTAKYGAADAGFRLSFLPKVGTPFFVTFVVFMTLKWWGNPPPAITQRIIASKDEKDASKATLFFAVLAFGFNYWPMIFAAMVSIIAFPDAPSPETGYAMLLTTLLPSGVLGLMMASLMAAFMSTVDTHINYGASYMVNDIYRRFMVKNASEKHYVRASQVSTVIMLLVAVFVAYHLDSVADAWYYMSMLTAGYGIVIVIRWFWWRVNAWAEIAALAASGVTSTFLSPKFAKALGYWDLIPHVRWQYRFLIVVGVCTVSWLVVCFLTEPDDEAHLVAFCERVKPFPTFWGPIYKKYPHIEWRDHFGRACLLWGVGALGIYSFCFGMGSLMFLRFVQAGLLLSLSGVIGFLIARYWKP
ncbi:sodium:solute symporter family protein [Desulfoluna sp.]|uniref:sodium:solute symporter family protein n=1 Tax=Desulfoluna sp. TaxID=2045199 RepID=UPI002607C3B1|nr:sodium:solute symporter family protein [Desulfoluna sp.]